MGENGSSSISCLIPILLTKFMEVFERFNLTEENLNQDQILK
tara:strand:- start:928 stop:1053 length:126 start_codon:yes stop_codon:yes gene_type:complete